MRFGALTQANRRGFAGGGDKIPTMDPKNTDFDVVFVGGINAAAMLKFTQAHDTAQHTASAFPPKSKDGKELPNKNLRMALVSRQ